MQPSRRQALRALAAAPAAAFFPLSVACAAQEDDPMDDVLTPAGAAVSDGLMRFALDLHGQLSADGGNVVASPWSVWTALAMLTEGARDATREQLVAALGLEGSAARADAVRSGSLELRRRLARADKKVSLTTADALWANESFDLREELVEALRTGYDAELRRVDFESDPEGAREQINAWVSKRTRKRIPNLMPEGSIDRLTELVLTDTIHFKGSWVHAFDEERTRDAAFTRTDGSEVQVPMMSLPMPENFPVAQLVDESAGVSATAIELPYLGERTSFVAIVPDRHDGLADLERWLDAGSLKRAIEQMKPREVGLAVPKMKLAPTMSLLDPLKALGVRDAFVGGVADLSGFSMSGRRDLVVTKVVHAAFLEVDEKGTEAAGATGVAVGRASVPAFVRLDRPFLFFIRERTSGAVLFLGRMADPAA